MQSPRSFAICKIHSIKIASYPTPTTSRAFSRKRMQQVFEAREVRSPFLLEGPSGCLIVCLLCLYALLPSAIYLCAWHATNIQVAYHMRAAHMSRAASPRYSPEVSADTRGLSGRLCYLAHKIVYWNVADILTSIWFMERTGACMRVCVCAFCVSCECGVLKARRLTSRYALCASPYTYYIIVPCALWNLTLIRKFPISKNNHSRSVQPGRRGSLVVHSAERIRGCGDTWQRNGGHPEGGRWFRQIGAHQRCSQVKEAHLYGALLRL